MKKEKFDGEKKIDGEKKFWRWLEIFLMQVRLRVQQERKQKESFLQSIMMNEKTNKCKERKKIY